MFQLATFVQDFGECQPRGSGPGSAQRKRGLEAGECGKYHENTLETAGKGRTMEENGETM